jgi:hypothetical protein
VKDEAPLPALRAIEDECGFHGAPPPKWKRCTMALMRNSAIGLLVHELCGKPTDVACRPSSFTSVRLKDAVGHRLGA